MAWVRVCPLGDLSETAARRVVCDGVALCVALVDGRPCAIDDRCPHREAALSGGLLRDGVITCPGHFRRFDLRTGMCLGGSSEPVRAFECAVADGWVQVDVGQVQAPMTVREMLLAHARAGRERGDAS